MKDVDMNVQPQINALISYLTKCASIGTVVDVSSTSFDCDCVVLQHLVNLLNSEYSKITTLIIQSNNIENSEANILAQLKYVTHLYLRNNGIQLDGTLTLLKNPNFVVLDLSGNCMSSTTEAAKDCTKKIVDAVSVGIKNGYALKQLFLEKTGLEDDIINQLKKLLPSQMIVQQNGYGPSCDSQRFLPKPKQSVNLEKNGLGQQSTSTTAPVANS